MLGLRTSLTRPTEGLAHLGRGQDPNSRSPSVQVCCNMLMQDVEGEGEMLSN